jgi:hypothetical protein
LRVVEMSIISTSAPLSSSKQTTMGFSVRSVSTSAAGFRECHD